MSTKSVLEVLEGVLRIPESERTAALRLMAYAIGQGSGTILILNAFSVREELVGTLQKMSELEPEDRNEILGFVKSQISPPPGESLDSRGLAPATFDDDDDEMFDTSEQPKTGGRGMMDKARKFLYGLPVGAKVTPISVCKRAGIDPANMYQLLRSLAKEGVIEKINPGKYKVVRSGNGDAPETMRLAEQVASMKPKRTYKRRTSMTSPRAYMESLPHNKVFRLKKVKVNTGHAWNSVTASAWQLMRSGTIKRKARGVYVRV